MMVLTDSYKVSHHKQLPLGTQYVNSYLESRYRDNRPVVFFGPQFFIKKYLVGNVLNYDKLDEATDFWAEHFGNPNIFNRTGWEDMIDRYGGVLPISIRSAPEGSVVPSNNVLLTVVNTDERYPWLTNWLETLLSQLWYPITVATNSRNMKQLIKSFLDETGTPEDIDFKLHDFGFRGVSTVETAGIGGCAHLVSFKGTDTVPACMVARKYYNKKMAGFSIPASEHSTVTSWGEKHEVDSMRNMLEQYPSGLVACVSDSYDIYRACRDYFGTELREQVLARDGVLVIRPDSGYPPEVDSKCLEILGEKFGYTTNSKGYKVLNPKVRLIQGDGIDIDMVQSILLEIRYKGWSADNISFGSGGGLLQKFDRDTLKFAFKCSAIGINDSVREVYKDPITDPGKTSKRGLLALIPDSEKGYVTQEKIPLNEYPANNDCLREIFRNGQLLIEDSLDTIRERAKV